MVINEDHGNTFCFCFHFREYVWDHTLHLSFFFAPKQQPTPHLGDIEFDLIHTYPRGTKAERKYTNVGTCGGVDGRIEAKNLWQCVMMHCGVAADERMGSDEDCADFAYASKSTFVSLRPVRLMNVLMFPSGVAGQYLAPRFKIADETASTFGDSLGQCTPESFSLSF